MCSQCKFDYAFAVVLGSTMLGAHVANWIAGDGVVFYGAGIGLVVGAAEQWWFHKRSA